MSLDAGTRLAHYEILEPIGKGGMGEIYLAEDTKLDRKVALKVLPPDLADNVSLSDRFQREAKALAALNHPNIITIHSVEEADGIHFITMELVQGKTLADVIPDEGMALETLFDIAVPLAAAVADAHFERARQQADAIPHRIDQADVPRWRAWMLLERDGPGDREQARELLGHARSIYDEIGMPIHEKMTRELLDRA